MEVELVHVTQDELKTSEGTFVSFLVYYESRKREQKRKLILKCRCVERLKVTGEGSTRLTYTGLCGELEHLKIKTRLIDEMFPSVMGECVIVTL